MSNYLWSNESVWCLCGHHIEEHVSNGFSKEVVDAVKAKRGWDIGFATCLHKGENEFKCDVWCQCKEFIPYKQKEPAII